MSEEIDSGINRNTEEGTSETENNETVSNSEDVKDNFQDLTLTERTEVTKNEEPEVVQERFGDESDGIKFKKLLLGCVSKQKKYSNIEDIEPYSKKEENWTYNKVSAETEAGDVSAETEDGDVPAETEDGDDVKPDKAESKDSENIVNLTESDSYNFTFPKRGYLLLVINEKFYNQAKRTGADIDLQKMKKIAKKFKFEIVNNGNETNLTKLDMLTWLEKAQAADHSERDCFMFMISTHGLEQRNPRKGGDLDHALVCADDQLIFTSSIVEMFNDRNCPSLKGKPKIFIIQACRGTSVDHGSDVNIRKAKGQTSSIGKDKKSQSDQATHVQYDVSDTKGAQDSWNEDEPRDIEAPCLKCEADMLIMYAIPPGMLAWRNTEDGSWMIHYMHEILTNYDMKSPQNFLKVLTKISAKMALRSTNAPALPDFHEKKAVAVIEYMLTRDVLFASKS